MSLQKILGFISNNIVAVFVVMIIGLIIVPLPTFFLDFMFLINISISLIILLITMYIKGPLEFSIFPSLLLVTTLLRVSLNISSTRWILSNGGSAGAVIETFGTFVLQGNIVVGFVIFIIIVLVQFLVITKGAERVAEVAARFTLDAMPGKQMAIDADLSAGVITEAQARERRENIQREADFYGAMDGATKLVKGDAIASIIITMINFVGGMIIGMVMDGGSFSEVLQIYSIATVGDGLVSQIPALLISIATGMIVTRAASQDSLSMDVTGQFLNQPTALIIAGAVMLIFCFIPGMPKIQLLVLAAFFLFFGYRLMTMQGKAAVAGVGADVAEDMEPTEVSETDFYRNIDNIYSLLPVEPIEMEFGYSLIPLVDESSGGSFIDRVVMFRRQFALDMGMVIPSVRLRDNGQLNPNQYVIKFKGEEAARGEVLVDYYLALDPGNVEREIDGIDTIEPAYGIPSKWITEDKKEMAEIYGYTVIDPLSVMLTHLSEVIKAHAHELFSRADLDSTLETVKQTNSRLVEEVVPNMISHSNLQKVLCNLLKEAIPIRDMESILETIAEYAPTVRDTDILTEYIRQKLKRTITRKFAENGILQVITLDASIEQIILSSINKNDTSSYLSLDPNIIQDMMNSLISQIDAIKDTVNIPVVLTSPIVRMYFQRVAEQFYPNLAVLSFNEIDNTVQIQALGNVSLSKKTPPRANK
ncbi:MAG: flagellar biosynthesis protein FlhA [Peptococcaceae bacterium]|nr:flagellar biosynthesis protein FlhA [Peptococcaceae bacterium]